MINQAVETLRAAANAISSRQEIKAKPTVTAGIPEEATSRTVVSGEELDAELELQQKTIKEMEAVTEKLDEVTNTLNELLERFNI